MQRRDVDVDRRAQVPIARAQAPLRGGRRLIGLDQIVDAGRARRQKRRVLSGADLPAPRGSMSTMSRACADTSQAADGHQRASAD